MDHLIYQHNTLTIDGYPLSQIAKTVGTPTYVYSKKLIESNIQQFKQALAGLNYTICYAVKANSNLGILNLFAKQQTGFDIVSDGELERVIQAKGDPHKVIFSGVGKKKEEIARALEEGIDCFNIESLAELDRIHAIAKNLNKQARIAIRINPNIDAKSHPYIVTGLHDNKFGIDLNQLLPLCHQIQAMPAVKLIGIGCHIGSQLSDLAPFKEAIDCLLKWAHTLAQENIIIETLDLGGGLGISYQNEAMPSIQDYCDIIKQTLSHVPYKIIIEPGRVMIGNAGVLLTRVEYLKHNSKKHFAIVDAGMNDLIRPALYEAWHHIMPVMLRPNQPLKRYDIVGPVCESADFLGRDRELAIEEEDLLVVTSAGAYGFSMSSNYNSRPRAAEVLVADNTLHILRERESLKALYESEKLLSNPQ